jgi:ABC-2 type transport system ATP-binding protein
VAELAVSVSGVSKRFGDVHAVSDVSFDVRPGEVFAFLGPNGAGKSTTINMLCTLTRPSTGAIEVCGFDVVRQPKAVRQRIGLVFQQQTLDRELTAEENLAFHAVLYRVPRREVAGRIDQVLEWVQLLDRKRDVVATFSGGMARRLEIARAMLHTPRVLFLDEPTVGLDLQTRARVWTDLRRLAQENGTTVFVTTHYLDEVSGADRIAILDHGRMVALDTPDALRAALGRDTVTLSTADDAAAVDALRAAGFDAAITDREIVVSVEDGESQVAPIVRAVHVGIRMVRVRQPTLDDVFLHFTGHAIREETIDTTSLSARIVAEGGRR